jgi:ApbE superfamily uncharacterized protein (UPF0280 family)
MQAQRQALSDARWHYQHGPIDLMVRADGDESAVRAAHEAAWQVFESILPTLVRELPTLRQPVHAAQGNPLKGEVARRMWSACAPLVATTPDGFITPMAAVAGAVAQQVLQCYQRDGIARAWVNNGGDIALHLAEGQSLRVGLVTDMARALASSPLEELQVDGQLQVHADMPVRGVATSGWRGRSQSLGIAETVTVLAATAAQADAAATLIGNAVNVNDARIERCPADQVRDDTDLGARLVTLNVPPLDPGQILIALQHGRVYAERLRQQGLIFAALLSCQGQFAFSGHEACLI